MSYVLEAGVVGGTGATYTTAATVEGGAACPAVGGGVAATAVTRSVAGGGAAVAGGEEGHTWGLKEELCLLRVLIRPKHIHKFTTLLPKDYYLIPGNGAIKLVDPTKTYTQVYNTATKGLLSNPR